MTSTATGQGPVPGVQRRRSVTARPDRAVLAAWRWVPGRVAGALVVWGAVLAVARVIDVLGLVVAAAWCVLSVAGAVLAVAAYGVWSGSSRADEVVPAGAWLGVFAVFCGLAASAPQVFCRMLLGAATLGLVGLLADDDGTPWAYGGRGSGRGR